LVADKKKPGIFALLPLLKPELYLLQEHVVLAGGEVSVPGVITAGAPLARPPHPMRAPQSPPAPAGLQNLLPSKQCVSHRLKLPL
jgi:hypothetical protein